MNRAPASSPGDTIFALSSGAPPAAIAIVRVSGPGAAAALVAIAGPLPRPRVATLRRLQESSEPIDQGVILWFPASGSATGEDIAEFQIHGGRAVVARLLDALARQPGLRMAEPGEFSRRAALNGRLSVGEAEALADLLAADTEAERRAAFSAFDGVHGVRFEEWRVILLRLSAHAEALIDHDGEADVEEQSGEGALRKALAALAADIAQVTAGPTREELRTGAAVVLAGPPNSGKSALLNALAGREAALVSPIAGTTRDLIEVQILVADRRVRIIDTAGLRETSDPIERMGVDRATAVAGSADLRIWLGDDAPPSSPVPTFWPVARSDLPDRPVDAGRQRLSSLTGEGVQFLLEWLAQNLPLEVADIVLNDRQRLAAQRLGAAISTAASEPDLLVMADHIRVGLQQIDVITGRAGLSEMFDTLFSGFCLGK